MLKKFNTKIPPAISVKTSNDFAQFKHLFNLTKRVLAESDIDRVLTVALDEAITVTGAERGMIVLFDSSGETLFESARHLNGADIIRPEFEISRMLLEKSRATKQPIFLHNALEDSQLRKSRSAARLRILSVMCLPLLHQDNIFGVVYLDNRTVEGAFKSSDFDFTQSFADFISLAAFNALERHRLYMQQRALESELSAQGKFEDIIGTSPRMLEVLRTVSQVAGTDVTVLIEGESGTGKELIARAIHSNSARREKPIITINCGAIPETLLEAELFGHEKGAFTGAVKRRKGKFESADGGTIFLDEIDEMSLVMQVKLLRLIQFGEYSPLGSEETKHCDVRLIAATKCDLKQLAQQGKFREDLYYRIKIIRIPVPALRERKEDFLLLAEYFLQKFCKKLDKTPPVFNASVKHALLRYKFPGNVRELENAMHHAAILCRGDTIELTHLPSEIRHIFSKTKNNDFDHTFLPFQEAKQRLVEKFEREYLQRILDDCGGIIIKAAQRAGMHEKNFHEKLTKYRIRFEVQGSRGN